MDWITNTFVSVEEGTQFCWHLERFMRFSVPTGDRIMPFVKGRRELACGKCLWLPWDTHQQPEGSCPFLGEFRKKSHGAKPL